MSLKSKIILSSVLIFSFTVGLSTYLTLRTQEKQLLQGIKEKLNIIADTIERSVSIAMMEGQSDEVQSLLEVITDHEDISAVRILNEKGRILRSSNKDEIGLSIHSEDMEAFADEKREVMFLEENKDGEMSLSRFKPINNLPECHRCHDPGQRINGIFEVHVSLKDAYEKLASNRKLWIISATTTILLLVLAIHVLFSRFVNRPITHLGRVMSRVENGDLSARCGDFKKDEIGRIGRSFNSMVERLEETQRKVEKHHQEQLQRADRLAAIGELAAGVAHEINNPTGIILTRSGYLLSKAREKDLPEGILNDLTVINRQSNRIAKITEGLLTFSRKSPFELKPTSVHEVIDRTLLLAQHRLTSTNIDLEKEFSAEKEFSSDGPIISADSNRLEQVFLNMINNAIDAMPEGGT
ncbi:MAG: sensor histidine kinase, partial [bacterium]